MKKFLKYISLAAVIIVLGLLVVPLFIPVENYKLTLIDEVKKATGREISINGNMSLSIFPQPKIELTQVKLSSLPKAIEPNLLEVERASAAVSIWSLFTGKIIVSYIELEGANITLETLNNGNNTWEFSKLNSTSSTELANIDSKVESNHSSILIKRLIIKNGKVQYIKGSQRVFIEDITLDSKFEDIKGPISFNAKFLTSGETFDINGKIKEIGEIVPIVMELKILNETIGIEGEFIPKSTLFNGKLTANGNLKSFLTSSLSETYFKGLQTDFTFQAKLSANKEEINLQAINLEIGTTVKGEGKGKYSIKNSTGDLNLALNPGQVIISLNGGNAKENNLESKMQIHSKSMNLLLESIGVDTKQLPTIINQEFTFKTNGYYNDDIINLKNINFTLGKAALFGNLKVQTKAQKSIFNYDLKTTNGTALIGLLGTKLPVNITDMQIEGETSKNEDNIETNTNIQAANCQTNIIGTIKGGDSVALQINTKGDRLAKTFDMLFGSDTLPGLGKFILSNSVQGKISKSLQVTLKPSSIYIGNDKMLVEGSSAVTSGGKLLNLNVDLESSAINIDILTGNPSNVYARPSSISTTNNLQGSNTTRWSREAIDLSFLQTVEGNINFVVQKLIKGSLVFDNIKSKIQLKNGMLNINSLTGKLYGGTVEASGSISGHEAQPANLKLTLKEAQLRDIIPSRNEIKVTRGIFNLAGELNSKGNSQHDYVNNLNGNITFNGANGQINGFDLQKVLDTLSKAKNLEGVLVLLDASFSGGDTEFDNLEGNFKINQGIANLSHFKLSAKQILATATGNINLPNYNMDINSIITIELKNMPPFKANLYGPLDNPKHKLETKALQQYLIQNVLTNVLDKVKSGKTKPADILKGIIGFEGKEDSSGEQSGSTTTQQGTASENQKPVDQLIQKGLESLFKR